MKTAIAAGFFLALPIAVRAVEPPEAEISNQFVRARVALPNVQDGYYRGTRFDWSGVIPSLEFAGHTYFGQRTPRTDPTAQGSTSGPVEDFAAAGGAGQGYDEAKVGESWVKIGVGVLKKPVEPKYSFQTPYEILDNGKWSNRTGKDWVESTQELMDPKSGYGYIYRKTVRLTPGKPQMVIEHNLKNTGRKTIETDVLNHNFFVIDKQPTGPDFTATFPYEIKGDRDLRGLAELRGKKFVYLKPVVEGNAATNITGYSTSAKDFDIRLENHKTGAGAHLTADRPLTRLYFWSTPTTICPEAYIGMKIEPGKDFSWTLTYDFYTLPVAGNSAR